MLIFFKCQERLIYYTEVVFFLVYLWRFYIYIYVHTHTYIYTHIHKHTHTYTCKTYKHRNTGTQYPLCCTCWPPNTGEHNMTPCNAHDVHGALCVQTPSLALWEGSLWRAWIQESINDTDTIYIFCIKISAKKIKTHLSIHPINPIFRIIKLRILKKKYIY